MLPFASQAGPSVNLKPSASLRRAAPCATMLLPPSSAMAAEARMTRHSATAVVVIGIWVLQLVISSEYHSTYCPRLYKFLRGYQRLSPKDVGQPKPNLSTNQIRKPKVEKVTRHSPHCRVGPSS